jgi:DNA-binding NtrC family response regulator
MSALRDMREDIPLLAHHFLERYKRQDHRPNLKLSPEALQFLLQREWPGNVRELQHLIKRAVLLAPLDTLTVSDFCVTDEKSDQWCCPDDQLRKLGSLPYNEAKAEVVKQFSITYLRQLLAANQGNVTAAARQCQLERQALQRLMRRYGILSNDFRDDQQLN